MGNYEQQYGEGEVFEAVLPNGSVLHIYIQFSMLYFLAEQLVMLILCPYRSRIARISRASSNFSPEVKLKMVRGCLACSFALGRERRDVTAA